MLMVIIYDPLLKVAIGIQDQLSHIDNTKSLAPRTSKTRSFRLTEGFFYVYD